MKVRNDLFADTESIDSLNEEERRLLFLMPLIETAWVCGAVSPREKQLIFEAAREESIDERHSYNDVIGRWLSYQPSREFFNSCLSLIGEALEGMTIKERGELRSKMVRRCREVAASAGGKSLMDTDHHISQEEAHYLSRLQEILA